MKGLILIVALAFDVSVSAQTWRANNGDGTFSSPMFYDEFSDPDLIRVGEDYYLTGTTMHSMPGLPVLHSRDLVNWKLRGYAFDRLDLGPEFRLEDGKEVYIRYCPRRLLRQCWAEFVDYAAFPIYQYGAG